MQLSEQEADKFKRALESDGIPHLYCNGFTSGLTNADVTMALFRSGVHVATLNLPFTVAKTLSLKLGQIISNLEEISGQPILTTDDIQRFVNKASEK